LAWPQIISRKEYFVRNIKKKQPTNTSARKQRQTVRPRCLVDRGTPLLSSSTSFHPGISTIRDILPWPSGQAQLRITLTPSACAQHSTTQLHQSHPATQHMDQGKTNVRGAFKF
jgi:hypothetical protein